MVKIKKGDSMKFNFHCAGVISQEKTIVTKVGRSYIQISHGEPEYQFDKKTGKCLNDSTSFGAHRSLPREYLSCE